MPADHGEVDGSVRFGASGVWVGAYFKLQSGRVAIRRRITPDIHWLEFDHIKGVDEIAPAVVGEQTIEFTLADGSVVGAQLPSTFVAELIGMLTDEPPASMPTPNSPPAPASAPHAPSPPIGGPGLVAPPTKSNPDAGVSKPKLALVAGVTLAVMAVALAAGWWFMSGGSSEPTLPGPDAMGVSFTLLALEDDVVSGTEGNCYGLGGYDDFGPGMDIEITDQDGKIIGSGTTMSLATLQEEETEYFDADFDADLAAFFAEDVDPLIEAADIGLDLDADAESYCTVAALVPLEGKSDFYKVDVGRRGDLSFSYDEMVENDWVVSLSLAM